jgi:hypothetical protein
MGHGCFNPPVDAVVAVPGKIVAAILTTKAELS